MPGSPYQIISWSWMGTFALWFVSAIVTKRTIGSHSDWQSRVAIWIVALAWRFIGPGPVSADTGLALTLAGLGLANWARFQIGRNWSGLVELKQDHELIRSGPYSLVRHPIYSGFMLATFGTAIAYGQLRGFLSFVLILAAWGYKSRVEETFLIHQFGAEYERYRHEVKGLIPLVW